MHCKDALASFCMLCGIAAHASGEVNDMPEIPNELLSALSQDTAAMQRFSGLTDPEKDEVLEQARGAKSPQEIDHIVSRL